MKGKKLLCLYLAIMIAGAAIDGHAIKGIGCKQLKNLPGLVFRNDFQNLLGLGTISRETLGAISRETLGAISRETLGLGTISPEMLGLGTISPEMLGLGTISPEMFEFGTISPETLKAICQEWLSSEERLRETSQYALQQPLPKESSNHAYQRHEYGYMPTVEESTTPPFPHDFKDDLRNPYLPIIKSSTAVRLGSNNGKDNKKRPSGESAANQGEYNYNNSRNNHSHEETHTHMHDHSEPELNDTTINVVDSVTNVRVIILSDSLSLSQIRSYERNKPESAPKRKCSSYCCPQQEIIETPNYTLFPNEAIKSEEKETIYLP